MIRSTSWVGSGTEGNAGCSARAASRLGLAADRLESWAPSQWRGHYFITVTQFSQFAGLTVLFQSMILEI
jgi:hypothetical protein